MDETELKEEKEIGLARRQSSSTKCQCNNLEKEIEKSKEFLKNLESKINALEISTRINKNPNHEYIESKLIDRKLKRVRDEFKEWSLLTKFDCYSKIFQTKKISVQLIWLSLFLIFTSFTASFVSKNLIDYFAFETVSKIDILNEKPTEFPALTICNANPFNTKTAEQLISNITLTNYGKDIENFTYSEIFNNSMDVFEMARMVSSQRTYGDSKRKLLGNFLDIKNCSFNNRACSSADFTWYYYYIYGNCWQFNTGMNSTLVRLTTTEGPVNGLSFWIALPKNENYYPNLDGHGLKLFIHNKSFSPRVTDEINIKAGLATNVAVQKTFNYKWPYPYSECKDLTSFSSVFLNALKAANKSYRQYDCIKLCLQRLIIDSCDCYWTRYTNLDSSKPPCLNLTQLYCINTEQAKFEIADECLEQCPLECETVTYDVQTSILEYPSQSMYNYLMNQSSFLSAWQNSTGMTFDRNYCDQYIVSMKIFYPFTQYTKISEEPKTNVFDLISQIGGSLGMLLGFSLFHLIEIIELFILVVISFYY